MTSTSTHKRHGYLATWLPVTGETVKPDKVGDA
jgi:hypothetical protein